MKTWSLNYWAAGEFPGLISCSHYTLLRVRRGHSLVLSLSSVWVQADGATVHSHDGNGKREHSKTSTGTKTPYQWHVGQRANLFVSWGRSPSKCINALSQPLVCAAFTILSHGHGKERKINLMAEKLGKHPIGQVTRETSH